MKTETLTSAQNPLLKSIRRAVSRGELTEDGACVAEGFHLLKEAVRSGCRIDAVLVAADIDMDVSVPEKVRVESVSRDLFRTLTSTETPQGIISLVRPPEWSLRQTAGRLPLVMVLDGIQEPGNAGAIVRTAEAFGASGVVFLKGSVNPYNPKCLRASAGSLFRLPAVHGVADDDFHALVQEESLEVYSTQAGGPRFIHDADLRKPCAIVIGSEARGVRAAVARDAQAISIPTHNVESLNAAVAAGVILYEAQRQRSAV